MSDYTPTVQDVAQAFVVYHTDKGQSPELAQEVFDRFIASVKADALREAADESEQITCEGHGGNDWFPSEWAGQVAGWLEHRADRLEEES